MPVWTAFINHRIAMPLWAVLVEPGKVHINDLQRHIFTSDYQPQMGPMGGSEIVFEQKKGELPRMNDLVGG